MSGLRFDRSINLGHLVVLFGLLMNVGAMVVTSAKQSQRVEVILAEHERRIVALESAVAELTKLSYLMKENLAVLTSIVDRQSRMDNRMLDKQ